MDEYEGDITTSPTDSLTGNELQSPKRELSNQLSQSVHMPGGNSLVFHDINYTVKVKKTDKQILLNCNGIMLSGLNAILGPTGSGKTSLLDILAGRQNRGQYNGDVFVNCNYQSSDFRLASGFVVQDDIVMTTLTVRENLAFSAALRLAGKFSKKERKERVELVIKDLGLLSCADSKIGNSEKRGVSGGERRRTSIGMELIISPDFLFLDEPTTGLDASTACSVMELLKSQGEKGRTIIFSIHQPRYSVFKQFDTITLLSAGKIVYHGDSKDAINYFGDLGYRCEMYNNPADHFLDVITLDQRIPRDAVYLSVDGSETAPLKSFPEVFKSSLQAKEILRKIQPIMEEAVLMGKDVSIQQYSYQSSFFKQLGLISKRTLLNLMRDPRIFWAQLFISTFMGLLVGAIYWQLDKNLSGIGNRTGVFFLVSMNMIFSNLGAIAVFLNEKLIFRNESANGYYRCSTYFIAKVICDLLPIRLIPILVFSSIAYFMIGLQLEVVKFFIFVLSLLMMSLASASVCFFISSSVDNVANGNALVSLPFVLMMIFSGYLNNLTTLPVWVQWLKYISIFKYGLSNLILNEFHGQMFSNCTLSQRHNDSYICNNMSGDMYLNQQGIHLSELWWNELALGIIIVCFLAFTYIQLRRMKKH